MAAGNYPKLGTYLHAEYPRQHRRLRRREELSGRVHDRRGAPTSACCLGGTQDHDAEPGTAVGGRTGATAVRPASTCPATSRRHALRHQLGHATNDYGTLITVAGLDVPGGRRPHGARHDASHLGGDNWVADATIKIMATRTGRASSSTSAPSTRSATCGAAARSTTCGPTAGTISHLQPGPRAVHRQERRRPARPPHRRAQGRWASSTTRSSSCSADHGSTARHAELLRHRRCRRRRQQLVLRRNSAERRHDYDCTP